MEPDRWARNQVLFASTEWLQLFSQVFKTTTLPALTNVPNSFLILRCQRSSIVSKGKRGRRRGREASMGERNTDGLPFVGTPTGNRTHKACALTRNGTHSL